MSKISRRHILFGVLTAGLTGSCLPAQAAPLQDFERELRAAYADYRAALFRTNTGDKDASVIAIKNVGLKWQALTAKWAATPPPQYQGDPAFASTLQTVAVHLDTALRESESGLLSKSHATLEHIRDELGELRRRNGVIVFSDRMNAFHERMEKLLQAKFESIDAQGLAAARDDAAVLAFLFTEIAANPPGDRDAAYDPLFAALRKSVEAMSAAMHLGEVTKIQAAVKALKPAYARFYLNYG